MMDVRIVEKLSFTVIGKLGQGKSTEGYLWIPKLWEEANSHYNEIRHLAKTDSNDNLVGIWGAMSDITERFERWNDQGKYLAGCEVLDNSLPPLGWTAWVIPSYRYAVIKCNQQNYQETFQTMVKEYLPSHNHTIVGAVHEFYNPSENNGDLYLYFPIAMI